MARPSLDALEAGVRAGDRASLARAITLIESEHPRHEQEAQELLGRLLPHTGRAIRVGVSGVPGAGKSTFIDAMGMRLVEAGHRVAVLTIDPSSQVSGGSILGDKTRMAALSRDERAYIRPSPSGGTLGGVARKTRESMLLCEAAGFDVVMVETVGVGQSETVVSEMVDVTLVLLIAGGGDDLQGIKRGILEAVDVLVMTKADGANVTRAEQARAEHRAALRLLRGREIPVLTCSSLEGTGLSEVWQTLVETRAAAEASGALAARRERQMVRWMWRMLEDGLFAALRRHAGVRARLPVLEAEVRGGRVPPTAAALELLGLFGAR
ncbi:MAG: methylmalonyl Co-A mutase-associated GTPase MeaB [Myxococcales bacterium]|nr:methylmalonyl Co-A mutase-associated GTPase MeaB [Myxococcales bacterium]